MVKYTFAALAILTLVYGGAALTSIRKPITSASSRPLINSRRYSAIPYDEYAESVDNCNGVGLPSFPSTLLDNIPVDNQLEVDAILAKKEQRRVARKQRALNSPNYQITLPIGGGSLVQPPPLSTYNDETASSGEEDYSRSSNKVESLASLVAKGQEIAITNTIGMSLRQVFSGRKLSELALDVDTLRFQSFDDELQGRRIVDEEKDADAMKFDILGSIQVLQKTALELLNESFDGVVVSSVARGGLAWQSGVRAGDVLTATSATMGGKLWPKSTLDGVKSALSSRKVILPTMDFEFRRLVSDQVDAVVEAVQSFELSLSRPIGINVEETDDGYVTILGISYNASPEVKNNLRVGDRVVSVESSMGSQMWDVYSVDGLTSAVTCRLPGQPVRISFERVSKFDEITTTNIQQPPSTAISGFSQATVGNISASATLPSERNDFWEYVAPRATVMQQQMLLSRSRDLLKTFIARSEVTKNVKVADRVIEAVMDASTTLDGRTLNLIMKAYITCKECDKAIAIFEEVFGLAGDGSERNVESLYGGKLSVDMAALNIFNISALLRAQALRGDYESALRVLAAVEGKSGVSYYGMMSRSWSGIGDTLNMIPDTRMYNIAIAAAAKRGTNESLSAAVEIFERMPNPSLSNSPIGKIPMKNLVTFNTIIDAFANSGQYQDAFEIFQMLKKSCLQPDRISYTTLIKASIKSGELGKALDLLDDMKWVGIKPDLVTYNNIIESLCNANRLFEAKDLVNEMERAQVSPDSMTYGLLMTGLLKANKSGPCLTLFDSACADERTVALTENVQLYTTAISAAAAMGDHDRALDLLSRMKVAGVKPNEKTLTALMGACIGGKKYDTAAEIFTKIKNPDSYAISVGLRALCLAGKFDAALDLITEHRSGEKALKGKQVMAGYNALLKEALNSGELDIAREALTGLLRAGYIPSKLTFNAIIDGLSLQSDMSLTSVSMKNSILSDEKFQFTLFTLDSLEGRKLVVDTAFYSSILMSAAQAGGLRKRIASLVTRSRNVGNQKVIEFTDGRPNLNPRSDEIGASHVKWEDLFQNYDSYKDKVGQSALLPPVRVTTKDLSRVLAAEQAVTYNRKKQLI